MAGKCICLEINPDALRKLRRRPNSNCKTGRRPNPSYYRYPSPRSACDHLDVCHRKQRRSELRNKSLIAIEGTRSFVSIIVCQKRTEQCNQSAENAKGSTSNRSIQTYCYNKCGNLQRRWWMGLDTFDVNEAVEPQDIQKS
jgi:hypothetical protein